MRNASLVFSTSISGPPLPPPFDLSQEHDTDNNFTYYLNWSAPFTWDGFPITSYNITIYNHFSNEATTTMYSENDSEFQSLSHNGTTTGDSCYMLDFYVSAANSIGVGEPSLVQSGHPIGKQVNICDQRNSDTYTHLFLGVWSQQRLTILKQW